MADLVIEGEVLIEARRSMAYGDTLVRDAALV
jgi:hypothetical protein